MPYITREDGERFVIPSYRDVLTVRQKAQLKKEIQSLSQNYGEYITLQKKSATQYEVAFSSDTGYLLGESIWHYFKRPQDMIYCEAIPNTTEAILVIVKNGSVYLDGSFPLDSIPEELVIFLTQRNNFEIYVYGDVPISQEPEPNKFSFEPTSVKSFAVLDKPIFPTLPLLKIYQLQLVDVVLKQHGIGVLPTRKIITGIVIAGVVWILWSWLTQEKVVIIPQAFYTNPYSGFNTALISPPPDQELQTMIDQSMVLFSMPGWTFNNISYMKGTLTVKILSVGGRVNDLLNWAQRNNFIVSISSAGFSLTGKIALPTNRPMPTYIYDLKRVVARMMDNLIRINPGNTLKLGNFVSRNVYSEETIAINFTDIAPAVLLLLSEQLKDLPVVLQNVNLTVANGKFSGTVNLLALGS